jgi:type VI secretion system secreted protein Hcp
MADVDMALKFEGGSVTVEGESTLLNLESQLVVQSFSWGATNDTTLAFGASHGGGQGKPRMHDMTFSFFVDKTTTALFKALTTNNHFDKVTLTIQRAGGEGQRLKYMAYEMESAVINSLQDSGGGSNLVMSSMTITYAKMTKKYTPQGDTGSGEGELTAEYDQSVGTQ